jgi:hypothetical protein
VIQSTLSVFLLNLLIPYFSFDLPFSIPQILSKIVQASLELLVSIQMVNIEHPIKNEVVNSKNIVVTLSIIVITSFDIARIIEVIIIVITIIA